MSCLNLPDRVSSERPCCCQSFGGSVLACRQSANFDVCVDNAYEVRNLVNIYLFVSSISVQASCPKRCPRSLALLCSKASRSCSCPPRTALRRALRVHPQLKAFPIGPWWSPRREWNDNHQEEVTMELGERGPGRDGHRAHHTSSCPRSERYGYSTCAKKI